MFVIRVSSIFAYQPLKTTETIVSVGLALPDQNEEVTEFYSAEDVDESGPYTSYY